MDINEEYFILTRPKGQSFIMSQPDQDAIRRRYTYRKLDLADGPIKFTNSRKKDGVVYQLEKALFDGWNHILVDNDIRKSFHDLNGHNFQFFPAIYIDNDGNWHENYWYINVFEKLDGLDLNKTVFSDAPDAEELAELGDDVDLSLETEQYRLSEEKLKQIASQKRKIFRLQNTDNDHLFVHRTVKEVLESSIDKNIRFISVASLHDGDEI